MVDTQGGASLLQATKSQSVTRHVVIAPKWWEVRRENGGGADTRG